MSEATGDKTLSESQKAKAFWVMEAACIQGTVVRNTTIQK